MARCTRAALCPLARRSFRLPSQTGRIGCHCADQWLGGVSAVPPAWHPHMIAVGVPFRYTKPVQPDGAGSLPCEPGRRVMGALRVTASPGTEVGLERGVGGEWRVPSLPGGLSPDARALW